MKQDFSYTVDATSDLMDRLEVALNTAEKSVNNTRAKKLQEIQKRIDDFKSRGLLKKQEYVSVSTSEFERRYYSSS